AKSHLSRNETWGDKISESFAGTRLIELLKTLSADHDPSHRDGHFADFLARFPKAIKKQTVFLPIFGISMVVPSWALGRIRLINFTKRRPRPILWPSAPNPGGQSSGGAQRRSLFYPRSGSRA